MQKLIKYLLIIQAINFLVQSYNLTIVNPYKFYNSTPPTWLTSNYFRAGNQAVIFTLTGNDTTPNFTFTYSSALTGTPALSYGIKNYRGNDYLGQQFFQIKQIGLTSSTFSVEIQIYGVTNLWLLNVAYLAVQPTFPHHFNTFENVPLNYSSGNLVNITAKATSLKYFTEYINYTSQAATRPYNTFTSPLNSNIIVLFMTSLWIRGTIGNDTVQNPIDLRIYPQVINSSHYKLNATIQIETKLTNIHFSQIIFNSDDIKKSQKYYVIYGEWYNDLNGGFMSIPKAFIDNFIMGLTAFSTIDAGCGLQYQWEFANNTNGTFGVQLLYSWTLTNTCGLSWSQSSLLYIQTWQCDPPYNYFNTTFGVCQTLCGGFTYQNTTQFICVPCNNTKCYQCDINNSNICTDCASYLFETLVNGTCVCTSGYFLLQGSCQSCSSAINNCISCTYSPINASNAYNSSQFICTACNQTQDYFLSGNLCQSCNLTDCLDCLNISACLICNSGKTITDNKTCVDCFAIGCSICLSTDTNKCSRCNNTIGFYLNASNFICISHCGDGIIADNQTCDDGNTINGDGCYSTCFIQPNYTCINQPSICTKTCGIDHKQYVANWSCSICSSGNSGCIECTYAQSDGTLSFNISDFVCSLCNNTQNYFLVGSKCELCNQSNCESCFDLTSCIICNNSKTLSDINTCIDCFAIGCLTCQSTNNSLCFICQNGFTLNATTYQCEAICGDGLVLGNQQCDDSNLISGDGCSSICQIQTYYYCTNVPSICSPICNDSVIIGMEECDDGNSFNGDGCSSNCLIQFGFNCSGQPSNCTLLCGSAGLDFYVNSSCQLCWFGMVGCSNCNYIGNITLLFNFTQFTCTVCNTSANYFMMNGSCTQCNISDCQQCNNLTTCSTCNSGFFLSINLTCGTCFLQGCTLCLLIDPYKCNTCNSTQGYHLNATTLFCQSLCGDGIQMNNQSCDDGNIIDGDGCSSLCLIESYYTCSGSPSHCYPICGDGIIIGGQGCDDNNLLSGDGCSLNCTIQLNYVCSGQPSHCYLPCGDGIVNSGQGCDDGNLINNDKCNNLCQIQVTLSFVSVQKDITKCNTLKFRFIINPQLPFLTSINYTSLLFFNDSNLKNPIFQVNHNQIDVYYQYTANMHNQNITFQFNQTYITNSSLYQFIVNYQVINISPNNNVAAIYLTPQFCSVQSTIKATYSLVQKLSYAFLLLSILPGKIIGLQLFGVLQLAFLAVGSIDAVNPFLAPLMTMKGLNGLSIPLIHSNSDQIPRRIKGIDYYPSFLDNFNIMFIVMLVEIFLALILYLITKLLKNLMPQLFSFSKKLLKQIFLTLILFNIFNVAYSAAVHFKYSHSIDFLSLVAALTSIFLIMIMCAMIVFSSQDGFGEFKQKFGKDSVQRNYLAITLIYRFCLGYTLGGNNQDDLSTLFGVGICMLFVIYNLINLPFIKAYHNYRACFCHIAQFIIMFVSMFYRSMKFTSSPQQVANNSTPAFIELSLILFILFFSGLVLIYDLYIFIRQLSCFSKYQKNQESYDLNNSINNINNGTIVTEEALPVQQISIINN